MTWPEIYRGCRIVILLWAAALIYLQSEKLEAYRGAADYLAAEVDYVQASCIEFVEHDRETRQIIVPRSH